MFCIYLCSYLCLSVSLTDTTQVSGSLSGELKVSLLTIGGLNLGYSNPALAQGLNGCIVNPASLSKIKGKSFSTILGLRFTSKINLLPVFDMSEEVGKVEVPCDLAFTQPSGINFIAFGTYLKGFGAGFGVIEDFGLGLSSEGKVSLRHTFTDTIPDTLTHTEIQGIPEGVTIPVIWTFTAPVTTTLEANGNIKLSQPKVFFGLAHSLGPFGFGFGATYRPIRGQLKLGSSVDANAPCTLKCSETTEWTVNLSGNTTINENIFKSNGTVELRGDEFTCLTGMILDIGFLKLGGTIEGIPAVTLKLGGGNTITYINGAPSIDSLYSEGVVVTGDTISGNIRIKLSKFPDTTRLDEWAGKYKLPHKLGVKLGSAIKLGPFTSGLTIGGYTSGSYYLSTGFESRLLLPLRVNLEAWNEVYLVGERKLIIPYLAISASSSFSFGLLQVDLGLKTNSFIAAIPAIVAIKELKAPHFFELFSPVIGVNLKF
ncbi:MAG: hypothetical protein QMD71_07965 [bacterium]|nr:hypothetical protein [bacterium]